MTRSLLVVVLAVALVVISGCLFQSNRLENAKEDRAQAEASATTASAQAGLNAQAGDLIDRAHQQEAAIATRAEEYANAAATAQGGSSPVPDDVLRSWAAGVDGLRDEAVRSRSGAATDPGGL